MRYIIETYLQYQHIRNINIILHRMDSLNNNTISVISFLFYTYLEVVNMDNYKYWLGSPRINCI